MNTLLLIKEKVRRAEMLHQAQLLAIKNRVTTLYNSSVFEERQKDDC